MTVEEKLSEYIMSEITDKEEEIPEYIHAIYEAGKSLAAGYQEGLKYNMHYKIRDNIRAYAYILGNDLWVVRNPDGRLLAFTQPPKFDEKTKGWCYDWRTYPTTLVKVIDADICDDPSFGSTTKPEHFQHPFNIVFDPVHPMATTYPDEQVNMADKLEFKRRVIDVDSVDEGRWENLYLSEVIKELFNLVEKSQDRITVLEKRDTMKILSEIAVGLQPSDVSDNERQLYTFFKVESDKVVVRDSMFIGGWTITDIFVSAIRELNNLLESAREELADVMEAYHQGHRVRCAEDDLNHNVSSVDELSNERLPKFQFESNKVVTQIPTDELANVLEEALNIDDDNLRYVGMGVYEDVGNASLSDLGLCSAESVWDEYSSEFVPTINVTSDGAYHMSMPIKEKDLVKIAEESFEHLFNRRNTIE